MLQQFIPRILTRRVFFSSARYNEEGGCRQVTGEGGVTEANATCGGKSVVIPPLMHELRTLDCLEIFFQILLKTKKRGRSALR